MSINAAWKWIAGGKLPFDGSIERISCLTEHKGYLAITNQAVLHQVAPLLRDKIGRAYLRKNGTSKNVYSRYISNAKEVVYTVKNIKK